MFQVGEAQPQLWVPLAKLVVPLPDGQQALLLQLLCRWFGEGEGMVGIRLRDQLDKFLEVADKELSEDVGTVEELVG